MKAAWGCTTPLFPTNASPDGHFQERLSQSALYCRDESVFPAEAQSVQLAETRKGMWFQYRLGQRYGTNR